MEKQMVLQGLRKEQKEIPFSLLYDTKGSQIYKAITELPEYYLYRSELELLKENAVDIAKAIIPGSLFVELGCGSASKTSALLSAIQVVHGRCKYVGIDISESALNEARRNLEEFVPGLKGSAIELVHASYLNGLEEVKRRHPDEPLCIAWLGSSVSNFTNEEAAQFFKDVIEVAGSTCQLLICMDMWKKPENLYSAYNNKLGLNEQFSKNCMQTALSCIGYTVDEESLESWSYEVHINKIIKRVEMFVTFPKGLNIHKHQILISPGERVLVEFSTKYCVEDIKQIASKACCQVYRCWGDSSHYTCQMLLPGCHALVQCWKDTDILFEGILDWNCKPIDLRHPYLFYYGHVCAFTKLKIMGNEEESEMDTMFSRGMDPNVLDPSQCHSHPQVPSKWPSKEVVINYVAKRRMIILQEVTKGKVDTKLLSIVIEHERMHQETLTYMVVQDRKISFERKAPIPSIKKPLPLQNGHLTSDILMHQVPKPEILIEAGNVNLGVNPWDLTTFTWDNEGPLFHTKVSEPFLVSARPVSIKDFLQFMFDGGYEKRSLWREEDFTFFSENGFSCPATWSLVGNEYYVHGPDSTEHWTEVSEEAVFVSLAEAEAFCKWTGLGCRVMTEAEYHRILDYDRHGKKVLNIRGDGWEWTSTEFRPFPGFIAMPEYIEYSTDFFDGKHYVLKGWSDVTDKSMRRDSFRNFYQQQYRYVFSKFRCCRSLL
uniref:Sulfatase-modifying factor enzyme domain-containing protein n=1 Tax=Araucaria cunninghamii TaxID=56994 RepID=A0A0D6QRR4_ARACU